MNKTRCAVIGVGYLGKFHAQKYAALPDADLVAVVDADAATADRVAADCGCQALTDHRELFGRVDAVSIAAPTTLHYPIARDFLEQGIHVLVEKPITTTVDEAAELVRIAKARNVVLQVGHLERFNAALLDVAPRIERPLFIESHRLAPFKPRATDVNVVLDLMIHDIDIILELVRSPVRSIQASGAHVLSNAVDIANARIEFESGCVANVTSSRVSMKSERKMRVFLPDAYVSIDFQNRKLAVHRKGNREMFPGIPEITSEESIFDGADALKAEIVAFLASIHEGTPAVVTGEDGLRALATAMEITRRVQDSVHALGSDHTLNPDQA